MKKNNNVKLNKSAFSRSKKKFHSNCKFCDGDHANKSMSKQFDKSLTAKNHRYRQTILSEYFSKQEVDKSGNEESKSAPVMVNFRKLVGQLMNAKVLVERLSRAALKAKLYPTLEIKIERLKLDQLQPRAEDKVRRYCLKCKTTSIDCTSLSTPKKCQECGTHLLYVCTKCNSKLFSFYGYGNMRRHQIFCTGRGTTDGRELYCCADCEFFSAYESRIMSHVSHTQHRVREMLEGKDYCRCA